MEQLAQEGLIDWNPARGPMRSYLAFMAHISVHGSKVIEGVEQTRLEIKIDRSINIHGSTNVHIGDINIDAEKIVANINSANATVTEREEAKSLFKKVLENPLLKGAIERWAKSFTGGS